MPSSFRPRFYLLTKESTETFGFCLHEELCCQGHVIRQLELGGVAQRRGLQDGDRLLQVNGHFVDHMDHLRIKASGNQVLLAVLDGDSYEAAKSLGRDLSQMLPGDIRPRLCHVTRDKSGFGFSVSCPEGKLSVLQDGPADRAGVPAGCWLLELNGDSVRSYSHTQLSRKVPAPGRQQGDTAGGIQRRGGVLSPAGPAGHELTALCLQGDAAQRAQQSQFPSVSLCPAVAGQFLWEVDVGLPAEQAGMKEGDRVLAVNGESIEGLDHEQTVHRIRAREDQVTLLVIDPAGDEFYHSVAVSLPAQLPPGISQDVALKTLPSSRLWEFPGELWHCPLHHDPGDSRAGSDLHVHGHLSCASPLLLSLNLWAVSVHHPPPPVPAPPFWGVIKGQIHAAVWVGDVMDSSATWQHIPGPDPASLPKPGKMQGALQGLRAIL
uniref:NHERF family PDZ scaffold protein 4 n=1 Tax=Taeniopygia guttata TaxID=59729 RepID=H0YQ27_TAEGU